MDSSVQSVDPNIPNMDFNKFVRYFISEDAESHSESDGAAIGVEAAEDISDTAISLQVVDEERVLDGGSLTSADSGIIDTSSKGIFVGSSLVYNSSMSRRFSSWIILIARVNSYLWSLFSQLFKDTDIQHTHSSTNKFFNIFEAWIVLYMYYITV